MGTVYRGERVQLGRPVAIKFLHPMMAAQEAFVRRFEVEARAMSRLSHPNCVSVIDFGSEAGPYVVMDFATGTTLRQALDQERRLEVPRALFITRQILAGLSHAHGQGIIHRDIKPENVVLAQVDGLDDHVRILDFGLARLADGASGLTAGLAIGTPSYMAPEQTGPGTVDERADIYAVGVVLFELLSGRKPFISPKVAEIMRMHREAPPPPLREVVPEAGLSAELEAVVLRAMAKSPDARFPSAVSLAAALDSVPEAPVRLSRSAVVPLAGAKDGSGLVDAAAAAATARMPASASAVAEPTIVDRRRERWWVGVRAALGPRKAWGRRPLVAARIGGAAMLIGVGLWVVAGRGRQDGTRNPTVASSTPRAAAAAGPAAEESRAASGLAEAESLAKAGQRDRAIALLIRLRASHPNDSAVTAALSRLYFEKLWWSDGVEAFRGTIAADPARRSDGVLIRHVIRSLMSDRFHAQAIHFLARDLGEPAKPYVEEAARSHDSPSVRSRAAYLLATWDRVASTDRPPAPAGRSLFRW